MEKEVSFVSRFKTLRHIETVRNYVGFVIKDLLNRQEGYDQSKLESPEVEIFEEYTPELRECTYDSKEYKTYLNEMGVALSHHYGNNTHHPEHFTEGIQGMTLIDLIEMLCDWKAATLRHNDGDIIKSISLNQKRFGFSNELKEIFINTVVRCLNKSVYHKAEES